MASSTDVTLFHFPFSYYSRRVLMALYERQIPFIDKKINIFLGTQNEDWYLTMNPKGEVPVLKHGDVVVYNSTDMIEYLDDHIPTAITLLPPRDTQARKDVKEFCEFLNTITIDVITYGIWTNPERSTDGLSFILRNVATPKETVHRLSSLAVKLRQNAERNDSFKDYFISKSQHWETFVSQIKDKNVVAGCLDGLEAVFERAEELLAKSRTDALSQSSDIWLFEGRLTIADIYLTILIDRLVPLGVSRRYFNVNKNPNVLRFWKQVRERPSFRKLGRQTRMYGVRIIAPKVLRRAAPVLMGMAMVGVAVGLFIAWRRT
ncbi:hypothetical protein ScPMuIL_000216 [Solemya velum]